MSRATAKPLDDIEATRFPDGTVHRQAGWFYSTPLGISDIRVIHAAPAIEVPPCLTARQYLDITETQPDP